MIRPSRILVLLTVATLSCGLPQHDWTEEREGSYHHKRVQNGNGGSGVVEQRSGSYKHSVRGRGQAQSDDESHQLSSSTFDKIADDFKIPNQHEGAPAGFEDGSLSVFNNEGSGLNAFHETQGRDLVMTGGFGSSSYQEGGAFKSSKKNGGRNAKQVKGAKLVVGQIGHYRSGPQILESSRHQDSNVFNSHGNSEQDDMVIPGGKLIHNQADHQQTVRGDLGLLDFSEGGVLKSHQNGKGNSQAIQGSKLVVHQIEHHLSRPVEFESPRYQDSSRSDSYSGDTGLRNLAGNERKVVVHQIEHQVRDGSLKSGDDQASNLFESTHIVEPQQRNSGLGVQTSQRSSSITYSLGHQQEGPEVFQSFDGTENSKPKVYSGSSQRHQKTQVTNSISRSLNGPELFELGSPPEIHNQESSELENHQVQGSKLVVQSIEHFQSGPGFKSLNQEQENIFNKSTELEHEVQDRGVILHQITPAQPNFDSVTSVYQSGSGFQFQNNSGELEYMRQQGNKLVDRLIEHLQTGSSSLKTVINERGNTLNRSSEQPQQGSKVTISRLEHYQTVPRNGEPVTFRRNSDLVSPVDSINQDHREVRNQRIEIHQVNQESTQPRRFESDNYQVSNEFKYPLEDGGLTRKGGKESKLVIHTQEYQQTRPNNLGTMDYQESSDLTAPTGSNGRLHIEEQTAETTETFQPESTESRTSIYHSSSPMRSPDESRSLGVNKNQGNKLIIHKSEYLQQRGSEDVTATSNRKGSILSLVRNNQPEIQASPNSKLVVHQSKYQQSGSESIGSSGSLLPSAENRRLGNQGVQESNVVVHRSEYREEGSGSSGTLDHQRISELLPPIEDSEIGNPRVQGRRVVVHKSEYRQEGSENARTLGHPISSVPIPYNEGSRGVQGNKLVMHKSEYRQGSGDSGTLGYQISRGLLSPVEGNEFGNHGEQGSRVVIHTTEYRQDGSGNTGPSHYQRNSQLLPSVESRRVENDRNKFVIHRSEYKQAGLGDLRTSGDLLSPSASNGVANQGGQGSKVVVHTSEYQQIGSGDVGTSGYQRSSGYFSPASVGRLENQGNKLVVHQSEYHKTGSESDGALGRLLSPTLSSSSGIGQQGFRTMHSSSYREMGPSSFGTSSYQRSSGFRSHQGSSGQEYSGGQGGSWAVQRVGQQPVDFGSLSQQQHSMFDYLQESECQGQDQEQEPLPGF